MAKTTVEYSGVSTLHGIHYIFESGRKLYISKVIWLLVVLVFTGLGIIWSIEASLVTYILKYGQFQLHSFNISGLRGLAIAPNNQSLANYWTTPFRYRLPLNYHLWPGFHLRGLKLFKIRIMGKLILMCS